MGVMRRFAMMLALCMGLSWVTACYYKPPTRRERFRSDYLSEAEAEGLIQKRLAKHGINLISNMKLMREGVVFIADGYDRDVKVGYEYLSHEGMDFEGEEDQSPDGLSEGEMAKLKERQNTFREFFLVVPEGTRDQIDQAVDDFIKLLYEREILKRKKVVKKSDQLFPDKGKKKDLIPWESTGDLTKKRKQMEEKEKLRKELGKDEDPDADWQDDDLGDEPKADAPKDEGEGWNEPAPDKPKDKPKKDKPKTKAPDDPADDVWGDDDDDF